MKKGRRRLLSDEDCDKVRFLYYETACTMGVIAKGAGVSYSVIRSVIGRKGAYAHLKPYAEEAYGD